MNMFSLKILTPTGTFYAGEVDYISADTPDGKVGFLRGAAPRVLILSSGKITVKTSVIDLDIVCGDGMIIVNADGIVVLSEKCRYENDEEIKEPDMDDVNAKSMNEHLKIKAMRSETVKKLGDKGASDRS